MGRRAALPALCGQVSQFHMRMPAVSLGTASDFTHSPWARPAFLLGPGLFLQKEGIWMETLQAIDTCSLPSIW